MGKVVFVPPQQLTSLPIHMPYGAPTKSYPVMIYPTVPSLDPALSTLQGSVQIPEPSTTLQIYDPLFTYLAFYSLSHHRHHGLIHSVSSSEIPKLFWSHAEIEAIAEVQHGDLLVQINDGSSTFFRGPEPPEGVNSMSVSQHWVFALTDTRDALCNSLAIRLATRKKHMFSIDMELREQVRAWLKEHATEHQLFELGNVHNPYGWGSQQNGKDEVFIRDDLEAIHFKMRWSGQEI